MGARRRTVVLDGSLAHWRAHARALLRDGVEPEGVRWVDPSRDDGREAAGGLFGDAPEPTPAPPAVRSGTARASKRFLQRLDTVACHAAPDTWSLLYRMLYRMRPEAGGERLSMHDPLDPDVVEFARRDQAVRRDAHKMHAFVRFRRVDSPDDPGGERFVAWHRPQHRIVARESGFFRRRFPSMAWSILTPHASAHWDTARLVLGPGCPASAAPKEDALEALWIDYYGSIFNPARVKLTAMRAEMPVHHWDTLPETRAIPDLLAAVPERLERMAASSRAVVDSAAPFVPPGADLEHLRAALPDCDGCELARNGTRAVPGEGPRDARIALVGEQPGDREERAGRPFVGPAGQVLDRALGAAGLERGALYLTNTVKHFHHGLRRAGPVESESNFARDPEGKRIHYRPRPGMVSRCQPWLDAEMARVAPRVVVCLGHTAARAVLGRTFRLREQRGRVQASRYASATLATYHPSAILRARGEAGRRELERALVTDLRRAGELARG